MEGCSNWQTNKLNNTEVKLDKSWLEKNDDFLEVRVINQFM